MRDAAREPASSGPGRWPAAGPGPPLRHDSWTGRGSPRRRGVPRRRARASGRRELAEVLRADQRERWRAGEPRAGRVVFRAVPRVRRRPRAGARPDLQRVPAPRGGRARPPSPASTSAGSPGSPSRSGSRPRSTRRSTAGGEPSDAATGPGPATPPGRRRPGLDSLDPRLRGPPRAGRGRDGRRLRGPPARAQPAGRPEDGPARAPRRPGAARPVPRRGRGRRPAPPPEHRRDPRDRRARGPPVLLARAGRGRRAGPGAGRRARCPPGEAAQVTETLARAIHYAHERGIIHRDLKPANVLLTPEGVPKIADFGLAKDLGGESDQTRSGTILGTPCYMAPEQAVGQASARSGRRPTSTASGRSSTRCSPAPRRSARRPRWRRSASCSTRSPCRPTRLRPKVPRDLETICLKCLEKSPRRRYASAPELAEDLERFLDFEPVRARPVAGRRAGLAVVPAEDVAGHRGGPGRAGDRDDDRPLDQPGRLPVPGRLAARGGARRRSSRSAGRSTSWRPS